MSAVNAITGNVYHGKNAETLGTGKWATFNQWRKSGYIVRKGEHGKGIMNSFSQDEDGERKFNGYSTVFEQAQVDKMERTSEDETPTPPKAKKVTSKQALSKSALRKVASQMSQHSRMLHIKCYGQDWTTDGYTAINVLVQPTKKACGLEVKPEVDLTPIVDGHDKYQVETEVTDGDYTTLTSSPLTVKVNATWYKNLCDLYPAAVVKVTAPLTPVLFEYKGKLVAVLMPVKG